jgi:hypothetical protein
MNRLHRVAARSGMKESLAKTVGAVAQLDVGNHLKSDPIEREVWKRNRRTRGKPTCHYCLFRLRPMATHEPVVRSPGQEKRSTA